MAAAEMKPAIPNEATKMSAPNTSWLFRPIAASRPRKKNGIPENAVSVNTNQMIRPRNSSSLTVSTATGFPGGSGFLCRPGFGAGGGFAGSSGSPVTSP